MKVYVQVVDTLTGISQNGMIEEPVVSGQEVQNAIKHFGIINNEIIWNYDFININLINNPRVLTGYVDGTSKIVNVVVVSDQPLSKS